MKSALTSSKLVGDDTEDLTRTQRFQVGLHYGFTLKENLFLTPGINYSQRGAFYEETETHSFFQLPVTTTARAELSLDYIDLILPVKFIMHDRVYALAGIYGSFGVDKKSEFTWRECVDGNCTGMKEDLETSEISDSDNGIILGLGLRIINNLAIEGVLQNGFKNLFDEEDKVTNQSLNFGVAYHF
ncbi:outer membrane beta-barrel protein [Ekhidna lutea]|uniref:outer membrane beta-barrel protein n=1 Tax=Ekhidna lutea TaxID=447679 RepID=UPI001C86D2F6|nr:outer membrane beta-barrel protein [Ekhidna lutea]